MLYFFYYRYTLEPKTNTVVAGKKKRVGGNKSVWKVLWLQRVTDCGHLWDAIVKQLTALYLGCKCTASVIYGLTNGFRLNIGKCFIARYFYYLGDLDLLALLATSLEQTPYYYLYKYLSRTSFKYHLLCSHQCIHPQ